MEKPVCCWREIVMLSEENELLLLNEVPVIGELGRLLVD